MANWQEFKEHSVRSGVGTALCVMLPDETKYHVLSAVESLPAVFGSPNTIEYSTTTNMNITSIPGKNTTESIEINIPYNIDNISICDKIRATKCKYAYIDLDDFSGQEFSAEARYRLAEIGTDSVKTIVLVLTVFNAEEDITKDLYDLYQDTVTFDDTVPNVIRTSMSETPKVSIITTPVTTPVVSSNSESIATVSFADNTLTITPVAKGSCIVKVVATAEDYASNQREIKVIVE